eukprot:767973-Hanusia_phi.AAC.9
MNACNKLNTTSGWARRCSGSRIFKTRIWFSKFYSQPSTRCLSYPVSSSGHGIALDSSELFRLSAPAAEQRHSNMTSQPNPLITVKPSAFGKHSVPTA